MIHWWRLGKLSSSGKKRQSGDPGVDPGSSPGRDNTTLNC